MKSFLLNITIVFILFLFSCRKKDTIPAIKTFMTTYSGIFHEKDSYIQGYSNNDSANVNLVVKQFGDTIPNINDSIEVSGFPSFYSQSQGNINTFSYSNGNQDSTVYIGGVSSLTRYYHPDRITFYWYFPVAASEMLTYWFNGKRK
jgi:hypothetical protein